MRAIGKGGADRPREAIDFRLGQDAPEDAVSSVIEFRLHSVVCFLFKRYGATCEAVGLRYGINSAALRLYLNFQIDFE